MSVQGYARQTSAGIKKIRLRYPFDDTVTTRLLNALQKSIRPHLRYGKHVEELITYQCLLESQFEMVALHNSIVVAEKEKRKSEGLIALLNLATSFADLVKPLQEKAITFYRRRVYAQIDEGSLMVKSDDDVLPTPPAVIPIPGVSGVFADQPQLELPLFEEEMKEIKEEPLDDVTQPRLPPPIPQGRRIIIVRKRKAPSAIDEQPVKYSRPSTSSDPNPVLRSLLSVKKNAVDTLNFKDVKQEEVEDRVIKEEAIEEKIIKEEEPDYETDVSESPPSIDEKEPTQSGSTAPTCNLLGVFSKKVGLELAVPWEGLGQVDEESNIGQPSAASCPFCPQKLIGKRSAITKHVKDFHKDLWPEFATLKCEAAECDYRATSSVTMKAHSAVSHGDDYRKWKKARWFDLPNNSFCPFCPRTDARPRFKNLADLRKHTEKEHLLEIATKPRTLQCNNCTLSFQYTNELLFHWSKRGNTCSSGARLIDNREA